MVWFTKITMRRHKPTQDVYATFSSHSYGYKVYVDHLTFGYSAQVMKSKQRICVQTMDMLANLVTYGHICQQNKWTIHYL